MTPLRCRSQAFPRWVCPRNGGGSFWFPLRQGFLHRAPAKKTTTTPQSAPRVVHATECLSLKTKLGPFFLAGALKLSSHFGLLGPVVLHKKQAPQRMGSEFDLPLLVSSDRSRVPVLMHPKEDFNLFCRHRQPVRLSLALVRKWNPGQVGSGQPVQKSGDTAQGTP